MLYVIDDKQLVGVNFPQKNDANTNGDMFLSDYFMKLPILGGWHGNNTPNLEAIMNKKPQVIITWDTALLNDKTQNDLKKIGIPALKVNIDQSENYPEVFRYLGKVVQRETRANALADMAQIYLDELKNFVATIPENERPKVYYAEESKGYKPNAISLFTRNLFSKQAEILFINVFKTASSVCKKLVLSK